MDDRNKTPDQLIADLAALRAESVLGEGRTFYFTVPVGETYNNDH